MSSHKNTFRNDTNAVSEVIGEVLMTAIAVLAFAVIAVFVFSYAGADEKVHANIGGWVDVDYDTIYIRHTGGEQVDLNKVQVILNLNGTRRDLSSTQLIQLFGDDSWHLGETIEIKTDVLWNTSINEDDYVGIILLQTGSNIVIKSGSLLGDEMVMGAGSESSGNGNGGPQAPSADFTYLPQDPVIYETVVFTDLSSDSDGTIVAWSWDFGDGNSSTDRAPSHQYSALGTYTITLTVTDNEGNTGSISESIIVMDAPETLLPIPVSLWGFDVRTDNIVVDSEGGNDGIIVRATRVPSGVNNSAIEFEQGLGQGSGNKEYITVPHSSDLDLTTEGSVEAWVYIQNYRNDAGIVHKGEQNDRSDESYSLRFGGPGNNKRILLSLNDGGFSVISNTELTSQSWYHVVATWNSTSLIIYINGNIDNIESGSGIAANPSSGSLQIGSQLPGSVYGLHGRLDEIAIYNYALDASEVQQRYDLYV